jgi:hypothetical protein
MVHRLSRFSVGQTAKVLGLLYALIAVILAPLLYLATMQSPEEDRFSAGLALAFPILYGLFGFVFTAIGCALYNWVAGKVGGIEVTLDTGTGTV